MSSTITQSRRQLCQGIKSAWTRSGSADAALPLIRRVLAGRGLSTELAAAAFLDSKLTQLHDPARLPGLSRAADRLMAAVDAGEPIAIYGDYDVDGVTATAVLF
ncbi:MAG: single-stranded-DNA-specific exonuclease RecJ, partial [bacterium]|nr:single-stranded-DNA-specific exonuclease RecJ [bacterium]